MKDGNDPHQATSAKKPQQQTGEEYGSIKGRQRDEDDFHGKSDTPRGSEPAIRAARGRRG